MNTTTAVRDRAALTRLIVDTCRKPGHAAILIDLLGQAWVGYAGAAGAYVARPPSQHCVLEAIAVRPSDLWLPVEQLDPARFPMRALHTPPTSPVPDDAASAMAGR